MVPSDEFLEWLWPSTRWVFDEVLYLDAFLARTAFILPTWEDFPVDESLEGEALVADYFAFVEEHSGTADWDWEIELVPRGAPSPAKILEGMAHHMTEDVKGGGVLVGAGDPLPIEYEPGLERDPELLVCSRGASHTGTVPGSRSRRAAKSASTTPSISCGCSPASASSPRTAPSARTRRSEAE